MPANRAAAAAVVSDLHRTPAESRGGSQAHPGPAGNPGSRADDVYARLLQAVNERRFRPGDRVLEAEVAAWLRVSRTPVREALRRLESEEILVRGTQGLTVAAMADEEVLELYDLREVLEDTAARYAAQRATEADLRQLRQALDRETRVSSADPAAKAAANRHFHVALAHAAHNRYLSKTLNAMQDAFLRLPSTTFSMEGRPGLALQEHRRIVDAIEARDPAAAARHARAHIRASRQARIRLNERVRAASPPDEGLGLPPRALRRS